LENTLIPSVRPTAAARMGVVAGGDSFATARFYKWILMHVLFGFHSSQKYSHDRMK
jgi:hypothetical protein